MKNKQLLIVLLALLGSTTLHAYDAEIDGIYYNFSGDKATVTYQEYQNYSYISDYTGAIIIPESVTYNGTTYSVTSIGGSAFCNCSSLTSITIPNSVTSIGSYAFKGCSSLTSVHISDLEAWCKIVFYSYDSNPLCYAHHLFLNGVEIKDLVIPSSVISIGSYAFDGCTDLTSIFIPASVTSIGTSVFSGCTNLSEIQVDVNNTTYSSLDGVLMNKSQTSIIVFPQAKESFILPSSVTSLNPGILGSNIKSFQIADSDTPLALTSGKFPNLENIYIGRSITLPSNSYSSPFSSVAVKTAVFGSNVTNISSKLFSYSYLQSVTIPSSVTTINTDAFYYCSKLKKVNYLGNINQWLNITFSSNPLHNGAELYLNGTSVSNLTFANINGTVGTQLRGCTNLKSVTIASGNTLIEQNAFYGCISLEAITIPKSVVTINSSAFINCNNLNAVYYNGTLSNWFAMTLTSNPLSLGADMYLNNTLLTNAVVPSSVTQIDTQLRGCTSLKTVTIPTGVTTISSYAFCDCKSLTSVSIPSGVTTIGRYSFGYCISLTNVTIPSSVTNLSDYAFYGCTSLQNIDFSGSTNYTTIDGVVYDKDVTKIISYPQGKTSTVYTYPSTITTFGGISNNPYLKKIYVPQLSSTPSISNYSFNVGENLVAVEFEDFIGNYYTKDGVVYLKYEYNGEPQNTLVYCPRGKKSLTISPDVLYLDAEGFFSSSKLDSLTIEPSERSIVFNISSSHFSSAFHSPLKYLNIGRQLYNNSSYLTYLKYSQFFAGNPDLETVVIGENMTFIPTRLFEGCTALTQITLPENITSVGANAFAGTPWLASLPMQDGVRYYNNLALEYEYSEETKNVRLKDGTSIIAGGLFENSNVESVSFPISVTSLESGLFAGCNRLKSVVLPNNIKILPNGMGSGAVENIHVPGSVTWIGLYAINACDTVVIEDGNNSLSLQDTNADDGYFDGVFSGVKNLYVGRNTDNGGYSYAGQTFTANNSSVTQLTELTFGPMVTKAFGGYDFRCCDKVKSVTCLAKQPFTSPDFYAISQTAVLYVPLGSKPQYESANGWSGFSPNIEEVTSVTITMDNTEKVYASDFDLDFSNVEGLKAYVAGDYDIENSTINLIPTQLVSAGKGVILKGAKGTYTVPCTNIEPTAADPLCGTISGRFIRNVEDGNVNYAFDKDEHVFKRVDAIYGCLLSRNEAYLSLPASSASKEIVEMEIYSPAIAFADANVKALCVANWDTNHDGKLSEVEAAAVTTLGEVFKGNTTITSFNELQYFTGLTTIGNNAFDGCTSLTSIAIPASLNRVKAEAFKNCTSLSKVIVTDIAAWCGIIYDQSDDEWAPLGTFPLGYALHLYSDENTEITEVVIPDGVTRIEPLAFRDAINVTSITIPNSVTYIGAQAFRGMNHLTSITIPQNVTAIEKFTFHGCSNLASVTIPDGVITIENNAFNECVSLTSISLPESLKLIGGAAFSNCINLTSITIPDGITDIDRIAFDGCPSLTSLTYNKAENALTKVDGVYQIGTAEDLCNFAILSTAANTDICAQLTADIDYTGYSFTGHGLNEKFQFIGLNSYCGTFDGNGHTITVDINNPYSWDIAALFRIIGRGGVVKNLRVAGRVESVSKFSAGIVSNLKSGKVSHCVSDVDIISHIDGDCTDGGIAGIATYDGEESIVEYCVVAGSFQGSNAHHRGGIIGIGYGGNSDNITIDNCLFLANVDGLDVTESGTFIRQPTDKTTINNCYYLNVLGTVTSGTQTTTAQMTSGELCFLLNGNQSNINWTQNLTGTDADTYPLPFSTHALVYANGNTYYNDLSPIITFADPAVKAICVANWDKNHDGELSEVEAAAVPDLGEVFKDNTSITSFNELQYFLGLTTIGNNAFDGCTSLASIAIPSSLTRVKTGAFYDCSSLSKVIVTDIAAWCGIIYEGNDYQGDFPLGRAKHLYSDEDTEITELVIPEGVTRIEPLTFRDAKYITSVTIPSSVTYIGREAFRGMHCLTSINIPQNVTSIESYTFQDCQTLSSVTIPEGVTSIGDWSFSECYALNSINIPEGVTSLGSFAFEHCIALPSIIIPSTLPYIGNWSFEYCSGLTSITIREGVSNIGVGSFARCDSLTSVTIPESVTSINSWAFMYCNNLLSISLPENLSTMGTGVFENSPRLTTVLAKNPVPITITVYEFPYRSNATLYVPYGSKASYQAANYWKEFKRIIEDIHGDVNGDEEVDVLDVVDIVRYVVDNPAETFVPILADINYNGEVNVGDAVALVNEIAGEQNFVKPWRAPQRNSVADDVLTLTSTDNGMSLCMENERNYTAFQFDLYLPAGTDATGMLLNAQRKQGHLLIYNKVEEGHYRVAAISTSNHTFSGYEGELLAVGLIGIANEDICLRNIRFFTTDGEEHRFDDIVMHSGTTTDIASPQQPSNEEAQDIYDLQGRKMVNGKWLNGKSSKGIYIVNGKKIAF